MFCSECGEPIPEGKAFCRYCGAPARVPPSVGPKDEESDTLVDSQDQSEAVTVARGPGWDQDETLVMSDPTEAATLVQPSTAAKAETLAGPGSGSGTFPPVVGDVRRPVPPPSVGQTEIRPGRAHPQPRVRASLRAQAPTNMQAPRSALPPPLPASLHAETQPRRGGRGMLIAAVMLVIVILAAIAATTTILILDSGGGGSGTAAMTAQVITTTTPALMVASPVS